MYDRELLSVHRAIRFFEPIIDGRELYILTDHKPLIYAISKKLTHTSDRVVRQLEEISQYSTNIIHISGESNIVADALSPASKQLVYQLLSQQKSSQQPNEMIQNSTIFLRRPQTLHWNSEVCDSMERIL